MKLRNGIFEVKLDHQYSDHPFALHPTLDDRLTVVGSRPAIAEVASFIRGDLNNNKEEKPTLIPFDLEAAKAGAPLVTRDGRAVDDIHHFQKMDCKVSVIFVVGRKYQWVGTDGREFLDKSRESRNDLFMAPKPKRYVNLYEDGPVKVWRQYATENEAQIAMETRPIGTQVLAVAIPLEIDA